MLWLSIFTKALSFQMSFDVLVIFSKVILSGSGYDPNDPGYIKTFKLVYSPDKVLWEYVRSMDSDSWVS